MRINATKTSGVRCRPRAIKLLLPIGALLFDYGSVTPALARAHPAPAPAEISIKISSWGRLVSELTIAPNGEGSYRVAERTSSSQFGSYDVVTKNFSVGAQGYQRASVLLKPSERYAGRSVPCKKLMLDMPYGTVSWKRGEIVTSVSFDYGCGSRKADALIRGVDEVSALADEWIATLPEAGRQHIAG